MTFNSLSRVVLLTLSTSLLCGCATPEKEETKLFTDESYYVGYTSDEIDYQAIYEEIELLSSPPEGFEYNQQECKIVPFKGSTPLVGDNYWFFETKPEDMSLPADFWSRTNYQFSFPNTASVYSPANMEITSIKQDENLELYNTVGAGLSISLTGKTGEGEVKITFSNLSKLVCCDAKRNPDIIELSTGYSMYKSDMSLVTDRFKFTTQDKIASAGTTGSYDSSGNAVTISIEKRSPNSQVWSPMTFGEFFKVGL